MISVYLITGDINFDNLVFFFFSPELLQNKWKFICQSVLEGIPVLLERKRGNALRLFFRANPPGTDITGLL